MGSVYLGRPADPDSPIPTPVVIKVLHPDLMQQDMFVSRFRHEAEIAATVNSPHVARVYEVGEIDGQLYMAMEYVDGWPLVKVLKELAERGQKTTVQSAVNLAIGALRGLSALHQAKDAEGRLLGIIHRDISPNNIMVGEDGVARLIDLGLGRSKLQDWKTRTGAVLGTPGYMAPEQVLAQAVDARVDLYAVGVLLWELLTFYRYVNPGPLHQMLEQSAKPFFRPPSTLREEVPSALDHVLQKALAPEPEGRFQTAEAFIQSLQHATQEAAPDEVMRTLLGQILPTDLSVTRQEISALMAQHVQLSQPGTQGELFVTAPTMAADPALVARQASMVSAHVVPQRRGLPWYAQLIALVAVVIVVFVAGALWQQRREPVQFLETLPVEEETAAPSVKGAVSAVPTPEPPTTIDPAPEAQPVPSEPPPKPAETKPTETKRAETKPVRRAPKPVAAAPKPAPEPEEPKAAPPPADPQVRLDALYRRVKAFAKTQSEDSPKVSATRLLLTDLTLLKTSRVTDAHIPKIAKLEARAKELGAR